MFLNSFSIFPFFFYIFVDNPFCLIVLLFLHFFLFALNFFFFSRLYFFLRFFHSLNSVFFLSFIHFTGFVSFHVFSSFSQPFLCFLPYMANSFFFFTAFSLFLPLHGLFFLSSFSQHLLSATFPSYLFSFLN